MKKIWYLLKPAIICFIAFTVLCGIVYPGLVTGIAQLFFHHQANGSIISVKLQDGTVVQYGSELIAQEFTSAKYLIGRPAEISNLSPLSSEENELVQKRLEWQHSIDPQNKADIPSDLVTASGSGVDPYISPEAAAYQVARIARARNISEDQVKAIIDQYTVGKFLGFWGE